VDGSASKGLIKDTTVAALGWCGIGLVPGQMRYSKSFNVEVYRFKSKVDALIANAPVSASKLGLLLVGKSLGGAKLYNFAYKYAAYLKQFKGVAVALVDAHDPAPQHGPGNSGSTGKWYKHVYLEGGGHFLKWWQSEWGAHTDQQKIKARWRFHAIYQRNKFPKGYRMHKGFVNDNRTNKNVVVRPSGQSKPANHWNISHCDETTNLLVSAIQYLQAL
jgi:hypothetical protein